MEKMILTAFLIAFVLKEGTELVLEILNRRHILRNKDHIPDVYKCSFDEERYQKSIAYTLSKSSFGLVSTVFGWGVTLWMIFSGFFAWIENLIPSFIHEGSLSYSVAYCVIVGLFLGVLGLPFSLYGTFVLEQKYGFNKTTIKTFILDMIKSLILGALLGLPLLFLLFYFLEVSGPYWWVWAFLGLFLFQFLLAAIYPTFLAPLFNKFTPLEEGTLKEAIEKIAQKIKFKMSGVFTIDGSKRSAHSNAYFAGMGRFRRIVLFDTIREQLNESEIIAVLAHEMGHNKLKHVQKMMVVAFFMTFVSFYLLSLLIDYPPLFAAFNAGSIAPHKALILFSLYSGYFTFFLTPLSNLISRKHEYEADRFSVENNGNKDAMASSLLKLSKENLSNLNPHPWYSFYYYSHPTTSERIEAINAI